MNKEEIKDWIDYLELVGNELNNSKMIDIRETYVYKLQKENKQLKEKLNKIQESLYNRYDFHCVTSLLEAIQDVIDDKYNEEEHTEIIKQLEKKYLGKKTPDDTEIVAVEVDYRKDYQYMNRVQDEYGNIFFVSELEEGDKQ